MLTGGRTSQPIGHHGFCRANPKECSIRSRNTTPEHMTDALWRQITNVNVSVNTRIVPMNDFDIYGKDDFGLTPTAKSAIVRTMYWKSAGR